MTLRDLPIGKTATIRSVGGEGALRQHFLDMGLIPKGDVTMVKYAPMGDPMELRIHSYELTLRLADAEKIEIENIRDTSEETVTRNRENIPHPGLGEGGKYHQKETEHPLPDDAPLTFALAGNQNCGKTTLFNQLTVLFAAKRIHWSLIFREFIPCHLIPVKRLLPGTLY